MLLSGKSAQFLVDSLVEDLPDVNEIKLSIKREMPKGVDIVIEDNVVFLSHNEKSLVYEQVYPLTLIYPELEFVVRPLSRLPKGEAMEAYRSGSRGRTRKVIKEASTKRSASQADDLIERVLKGADPKKLMLGTIKSIKEGKGSGPYPMGSFVKMNQAGTFEKIGGGTVTINKGDTVSIVNPHLGENGYSKLVLLPDGVTKAVVPLAVLGEQEGDMDGTIPDATGTAVTVDPEILGDPEPDDEVNVDALGGDQQVVDPEVLGDPEPENELNPDADGTEDGVVDQTVLGDPEPTTSAESVAFRATKAEVMQCLEMLLDGDKDANSYRRVNELRRAVAKSSSRKAVNSAYSMLFSEESYPFSKIEKCFEQDDMDDDEEDDEDNKDKENNDKKNNKPKGESRHAFPLRNEQDVNVNIGKEDDDEEDDEDDEEDKVVNVNLNKNVESRIRKLRARANRLEQESNLAKNNVLVNTSDDDEEDDEDDMSSEEADIDASTPFDNDTLDTDDEEDFDNDNKNKNANVINVNINKKAESKSKKNNLTSLVEGLITRVK